MKAQNQVVPQQWWVWGMRKVLPQRVGKGHSPPSQQRRGCHYHHRWLRAQGENKSLFALPLGRSERL